MRDMLRGIDWPRLILTVVVVVAALALAVAVLIAVFGVPIMGGATNTVTEGPTVTVVGG